MAKSILAVYFLSLLVGAWIYFASDEDSIEALGISHLVFWILLFILVFVNFFHLFVEFLING